MAKAIPGQTTVGDADSWPLYVTDDGIVQCYQDGCDGFIIGNYVKGRRVSWLDFENAFRHHALVDHGELI